MQWRLIPRSVWPLLLALGLGCGSGGSGPRAAYDGSQDFWPSSMCAGCHVDIARQHGSSLHARSYENPLFKAQFFSDYLPRMHDDLAGFVDEPPCMACHAPMAYLESGYYLARERRQTITSKNPCDACHGVAGHVNDALLAGHPELDGSPRQWRLTFVDAKTRNLAKSGVGCDFCHTIVGTLGSPEGNANYVSAPGPTKRGPFEYAPGTWHRAYSELHTQSRFCAICHNASNRFGVEIRSTFSEWRTSPLAAAGIQCQDCHMSVHGFLKEGKAEYESGQAAVMTLGSAPHRDKLYTHRFVGAHSDSQIEGTVSVHLGPVDAVAGSELRLPVEVHLNRTGHHFPTGSPELRTVWLQVEAWAGDTRVSTRVADPEPSYGRSGDHDIDAERYRGLVPDGSRLYRSVFLDPEGWETLAFYDAAERVFDNRLASGEVRREEFTGRVPGDAAGTDLVISVEVFYLRYPPGFAADLGQPTVEPVRVASASTAVPIAAANGTQAAFRPSTTSLSR